MVLPAAPGCGAGGRAAGGGAEMPGGRGAGGLETAPGAGGLEATLTAARGLARICFT
jgi:hypothetical protein